YRAVGGFAPLAAHEDRALLEALERAGFAVARRATPAVVTSARPPRLRRLPAGARSGGVTRGQPLRAALQHRHQIALLAGAQGAQHLLDRLLRHSAATGDHVRA